MRTVKPEEIAKLYQFTREHYVSYYDVQTELVDHLASAIEKNWQQNPERSFEENLQLEFKKFGIYGFSDVVAKKERAMEKEYFKLIWREIKQDLQRPKKLLLLSMLFLAAFTLLRFENGLLFLIIGVFLYYAVLLCLFLNRAYSIRKKMKEKQKVYLLEAVVQNAGAYFSFFWMPFYIFNSSISSFSIEAQYVQVITALVTSILVLVSYVCYYKIPGKKDLLLKERYPEMNFLE